MNKTKKLNHVHFVLQEAQRQLGDDACVDIDVALEMVEDVRDESNKVYVLYLYNIGGVSIEVFDSEEAALWEVECFVEQAGFLHNDSGYPNNPIKDYEEHHGKFYEILEREINKPTNELL
ncbi:MAG: hypothetical protein ACO29Y_05865 [Holophagaceae bacterium]